MELSEREKKAVQQAEAYSMKLARDFEDLSNDEKRRWLDENFSKETMELLNHCILFMKKNGISDRIFLKDVLNAIVKARICEIAVETKAKTLHVKRIIKPDAEHIIAGLVVVMTRLWKEYQKVNIENMILRAAIR